MLLRAYSTAPGSLPGGPRKLNSRQKNRRVGDVLSRTDRCKLGQVTTGLLAIAMQQIAGWLKKLGMSEYAQRFSENDIDFDILPELTDQDLEKLGVSLGHRRRMLKAIRELGDPALATLRTGTEASTDPQLSAERRQLTVMLCDLVGSTALSTRLDPEDLREIISAYHQRCAELITKHGGFVARYMGDGVLTYFGYPQANEHDAERAVRAGLALVEAVQKLETGAGVPLQARIGIATGLVVVGDLIGVGAAQEQAVVGETPNLAARLQALAEPGAVMIESRTRRMTGGLFEYRDLGTVTLKGFAENVPTWQVLGADATVSRFEALHATTTPLIGREEEMDLLLRRWDQAKRGEGCVVLLSGEPGIGKSRIAQTIVERLSNEPHTRLRYFCSPHHQDSALYPVITQLERAAGFRRDDSDEQRLDKLEALLSQGTTDLSGVVPLFADWLSIPTGDRYPTLDLTPEKRKQKTHQVGLAQVEGLAARQPLLMLYEDLHWSDPTTREGLDLLLDRIPALRVLVIMTFRSEFTPPWAGRSHVTLLTLNRLPLRHRAEMITHVAGGKILPKEIANQIMDRTDGIPLFIEELTKAVVESGVLTETDGGYRVEGPIAPLSIPTTLHASLLARLDRLAPTREVAQTAAALGRTFSHELISAVTMMSKPQLDDALARLVAAELIFQRGTPPDAEYTFKHALVQDAAYSTLLRSRRLALHARIIATLEGQFPETVAAQPALLAQHCAKAGLADNAVMYWLKAGQQAMVRSATTEAVAQLQKGLDELADLPDGPRRQQQELGLRVALASALAATKGYSATDVGNTIARAHALAEQIDQPEHLVPLIYGQWAFHMIRSEHKQALLLAEQIERIGETRNDVVAQLQGRRAQGVTRYYLGEFVAARALLERCHGLGEPTHRATNAGLSADPYAMMLAQLAVTLAHLGYVDQARVRFSEALSEARRLRHALTLANVLTRANWFDWFIRTAEAQRHAEELLVLSTEHGFPLFLGWAIALRGWGLVTLGQAREGLALLKRGLTAVRDTGAVASTPQHYMWLAEACAMLGQPLEGLEHLAEAEEIVKTKEERVLEAELHRMRGNLLRATGDRSAAEHSYHRALAIAKRQSAKLWELLAAMSLARLWRDQDKRTEARELLAPIYDWFTEGFDTPVLQDAKALLDELA
jgi:class 3 adenylate cyclase/tetratricopeptide (TPR) repeat protein